MKGALRGRVKRNERVMVLEVFLIGRLIVYRENGGTCQNLVCEPAGGLMGSSGGSGVIEDFIYCADWVGANTIVAIGVSMAAMDVKGEEIEDVD